MFLGDLRGHQVAGAWLGDAAREDRAPKRPHATPDDQLVADCRELVCQLGILLDGIEQAANAEASEHERLTMSLRHADNQVSALIDQIGITQARTVCGVQSKHAVADLLLSTTWYDPSPHRDTLLLSFLRDAHRLHYPAALSTEMLACEQLAETGTLIASGEACLRLIEALTSGFEQLEQDEVLAPSGHEQLDATLFDVLQRTRAAIMDFATRSAGTVAALQVKSLVLQRLLEISDGDASQLRVDLSRSYLNDLNVFAHANERRREASHASNSLWSTVSSKVRCWMSSGHHC